MSADLLRRAAKTLREAAEVATSGPWQAHPDGLVWAERPGDPVSGSTEPEDADYIALMHPPVALALADLLLELADHIEAAAPIAEALDIEAHEVLNMGEPALAVARAILREDS